MGDVHSNLRSNLHKADKVCKACKAGRVDKVGKVGMDDKTGNEHRRS